MDRMAELAEELYDEAVRRSEAALGERVSFPARLKANKAARLLCDASLDAAQGRHDAVARDRASQEES